MRARVIIRDNFGVITGTSKSPTVDMFWGTSGIDKVDVKTFDSTYIGELQWDNAFDLAKTEN
jgi:hypothetical protein